MITEKVVHGLYPGVSTVDLDNLAAEIASSMTTKHPDYGILAARIAISNLHKDTKDVFSGKLCISPWILSSQPPIMSQFKVVLGGSPRCPDNHDLNE